MTAQPHDFLPGGAPDPAKSLRAIRAALVVGQDREAFDAGLKAVLDEVRVNLDLGVLNDFVHRWWISACDSARDPEGRPAESPPPPRGAVHSAGDGALERRAVQPRQSAGHHAHACLRRTRSRDIPCIRRTARGLSATYRTALSFSPRQQGDGNVANHRRPLACPRPPAYLRQEGRPPSRLIGTEVDV